MAWRDISILRRKLVRLDDWHGTEDVFYTDFEDPTGEIYESLNDEQYYIAAGPMSGPGEVDAEIILADQYDDYNETGWDIEGPMSEREADLKYSKILDNNGSWRYLNAQDEFNSI